MAPQDGGTKLVVQCGGCGVGRPPRGFVARSAFAPNAVAERLAQMAQLEAASVGAFHSLHARRDADRAGDRRSLDHRARSLSRARLVRSEA
jgi:hypothetical protein